MSKIVDNVSELTDREKNELLEWMCKEEVLSFVYNHLSSVYGTDHVRDEDKVELWNKVQDARAALARHHGSREIFFSDKMRSALSGYASVEDMIKEGDV